MGSNIMNLSIIFEQPLAIVIHILASITMVVLGPVAVFRTRRDTLHRAIGYTWVSAMLVLAASSFLLHGVRHFGPFSLIHLLSIFAFVGVYQAIRAARARRFVVHRNWMIVLYAGALGAAGTGAFVPDRLMNAAVFGEPSVAGFIGAAVVFIVSAAVVLSRGSWSWLSRLVPRANDRTHQ